MAHMTLSELQQKYAISFKKSLGQNILLDDNINRIMVDAAALTEADSVVEVGAGLGALTQRLVSLAGQVFAVEIDRSFFECLEDQFGDLPNIKLFRGDILNHDLDKLLEEYMPEYGTLKMVSNLPYYITTPILFHFWESPVEVERQVVMVQEEVGQRLVASVGSRDYSKLSLAARYYGEVDIVHHVPRTCFRPQPKVDSCIVRIRTHETPLFPDVDHATIMKVINVAFSQRRKTLRNSLAKSGNLGIPKEIVEDALQTAEIDPARRPQTLELEEFAILSKALQAAQPSQ